MLSLLAFLAAMLCAPLGFSCLLIQWLVLVTLVLDVGVPALGCTSNFLPECRFVEVVQLSWLFLALTVFCPVLCTGKASFESVCRPSVERWQAFHRLCLWVSQHFLF